MTYQTIEKRLKKYNSNFFYFLKAHTYKNKAIINTKSFSVEFLEEILKCIKEYKEFEIDGKDISLINSIYIDEKTEKIRLDLSVIWCEIITKG